MASPRRITSIVALIMVLLVSSVTAQLEQNMEMVEIPKAQSTDATGEAKTTIHSLRSGGDFAAEVSHKEERLSYHLALLWLEYVHKYRTTMGAANNDVLDIVKAVIPANHLSKVFEAMQKNKQLSSFGKDLEALATKSV